MLLDYQWIMSHLEKILKGKGARAHKRVWMSWSIFINFEKCQSMIKWIEVFLKKKILKEKELDKVEVYYESGSSL